MNGELRASIVAKLRAEANRIESGDYDPDCYAVSVDEHELGLTVDEAIKHADPGQADEDDGWPEDIDMQEWGVYVPVQRVQLTAHGRATGSKAGRFGYIAEYALVDADVTVTPSVLETYCDHCEQEAAVAPGDDCPGCAALEAATP